MNAPYIYWTAGYYIKRRFSVKNQSMKKTVCLILIAVNLFFCASCTAGSRDVTRLYLIYMNGSDLESDYGAASADLSEMMSARLSDDTRIFVQTGGTKFWHNDTVSADANERYEIADGKMEKVWEGEAENMGKASTLSDFIYWGVTNYAADEYYLILWNHGGGAVSGFGKDEIFFEDTLMLSELSSALAQSESSCGVMFNTIAFDACLMASIENIALISPYCSYIVASQELVPSSGFSYKRFFNAEGSKNGADGGVAVSLAETYFNAEMKKSSVAYLTVSVIDTKKTKALMEAFINALPSFEAYFTDNKTSLAASLAETMSFGGQSRAEGYSNMVDLESLMKYAGEDCSDAVTKAVNEAVIYKRNGLMQKDACGISVYYPKYMTEDISYETALYASSGFCAQYTSFVSQYTAALSEEDKSEINESLDVSEPLVVNGKDVSGELIGSSLMYEYYVVSDSEDENVSYRVRANKLTGSARVIFKCFGVDTDIGLTEQKYILVKP